MLPGLDLHGYVSIINCLAEARIVYAPELQNVRSACERMICSIAEIGVCSLGQAGLVTSRAMRAQTVTYLQDSERQESGQ